MMTPNTFDQATLDRAEQLIREGSVTSVVFSEGTYQIEVKEKGKSYWPFIQLSDTGEILDSFCTCFDKKESCVHEAVAYLKIWHGKEQPLHIRFRNSLWNQLCLIASSRHGYKTDVFDHSQGYQAFSETKKLLFSVQPLNTEAKKKLKEMIDHRVSETEETSLKFSNLPLEEIQLWKKGQPSQKLLYELSFWSDLAKWCIELQEQGHPYKIEFLPSLEDLPKWIQISFDCLNLGFYIAKANWPKLIPSLSSVQSPLSVYETEKRQIKQIQYLPEHEKFSVVFDERADEASAQLAEKQGTEIGQWKFIPKQGFYRFRPHPLFQVDEISFDKIALFLDKYTDLFRTYTQEVIHEQIIKPKYNLTIDDKQSLHIEMYLFALGDLAKPYAAVFGHWVYLPTKGFYRLESTEFLSKDTIIPPLKMSDFITQHRIWLNEYEGFQLHLMALEPHVHYEVDADGTLSFFSEMDLGEESRNIIDYGEWILIRGKGFFPKKKEKMMPSLKSGLTIEKTDVPSFIRRYQEELRMLTGFYATHSPVERMSLEVRLTITGQIAVLPLFELFNTYRSKTILFFGEYTYVKNEGFCEIPYTIPLLAEYVKPKTLAPQEEVLFLSRLESLLPLISFLDPRLKLPKKLILRVHDIKQTKEVRIGQWVMDLKYESELGAVDVYELWQALQTNKQYLFSKAGLLHLNSPMFSWLKELPKKRWSGSGKKIRLNALEWIRMQTVQEILPATGEKVKEKKIRKILEEFHSFRVHVPLDLTGLHSDLRSYQETGVKWLWFLYCYGLSGMLCDEMGLGKTHQAMALLAAVKNGLVESKQFLVVCPTSVIYHWEQLLKRFVPHLKVHVFYGQERKLQEEHEYDVLVTSYGILRSEKKVLEKRYFQIAIFDEIQNAKNAHSQTHKALKALQSHVKIGLTGTPIENNILELKALFDIILPQYLPSDAQFKEQFLLPIEKNQDEDKKRLLSALIHPFILRRKKTDVLQELPEKIEELAYCDLSEEQRALYKQYFFSKKEEMVKELESVPERGLVHIFSLLAKLKQICNHPCMLTKDFEHFLQHHSGKWDLFVELLHEARESKQKIVVFTQYLDMMDMIESYLIKENIGFAEIRGSTRDRKEPLIRFKDDPDCEVFVASLQAAGVGIDLTAASVVIHYDRWWNPAKENQATDRVHRIGQNRGVQVFKLVTKRTVEERIDELIQKKKGLLDEVIGFDDQDLVKGFTKQEVYELLDTLEKDLQDMPVELE